MLTLFPRIRPNPTKSSDPADTPGVPVAQVTVALTSAPAAEGMLAELAAEVAVGHTVAAAPDAIAPGCPAPGESNTVTPSDDRPTASFEAVPSQFSIFTSALEESASEAVLPKESFDVNASQSQEPVAEVPEPEAPATDAAAVQPQTFPEGPEIVQSDIVASGVPEATVSLANGTIFDEIEVLHEASAFPGDAAPPELGTESAQESQASVEEPETNPSVQESAGAIAPIEPPPAEPVEAHSAPIGDVSPAIVEDQPAQPATDAAVEPGAKTETRARAVIAPKQSRESFFVLPRVPEPEVMEDSGEVEAYTSAAAQAHLDAIDDTFVAHAQLLLKGRERGRALDIGTGPGQIVLKLGYRLTRWKFVGVDRSAAMIEKAHEALVSAPELAGRVEFCVADGNRLDFPDASFDLVVCNSVLHHLAEPQNLFAEIARLVKPDGAILLRDLRRPSRMAAGAHVRKHGKYYQGEMRRLFEASVRAAYTEDELRVLVASSVLRGVEIFLHQKTHIGFQRPFRTKAAHPSRKSRRS